MNNIDKAPAKNQNSASEPCIGNISYGIGEVVLNAPLYARFVMRVKEDPNVERGIKFLNSRHLSLGFWPKMSLSLDVYFTSSSCKDEVRGIMPRDKIRYLLTFIFKLN